MRGEGGGGEPAKALHHHQVFTMLQYNFHSTFIKVTYCAKCHQTCQRVSALKCWSAIKSTYVSRYPHSSYSGCTDFFSSSSLKLSNHSKKERDSVLSDLGMYQFLCGYITKIRHVVSTIPDIPRSLKRSGNRKEAHLVNIHKYLEM